MHVGTVPITAGWALQTVRAPVVEPGVEDALRAAVNEALSARGAQGERPLVVTVLRADWNPSRRSGNILLYDAVLVAQFASGDVVRETNAVRTVVAPATAAEAAHARAAAFDLLAHDVAIAGVALLAAAQ